MQEEFSEPLYGEDPGQLPPIQGFRDQERIMAHLKEISSVASVPKL